jgi:hypothetical protein
MNLRHHRRQSDSAGPLDIIIEAWNLLLVFLEQPLGVRETKVLEL